MRKNKLRIILFLIAISTFIILPFNPIVQATPTNWIKLDDFESYNLGATNGTNGDLTWERFEGDDMEIAGVPLSDQYLRASYNDGDYSKSYFNTTEKHFGYYFCFKIHNGGWINCQFYNSTGSDIIYMNVDSTLNTIRYKDWDNVYHIIGEYSYDTIYYFSWVYYTGTVVQYRVYDEDWELLYLVNGTGRIAGDEFTSEEQFNLSVCKFSTNAGGSSRYINIYEYGYIEEDLYDEDDFPKVIGAIFKTDGAYGLKDVEAGTFVNYDVEIIGDDDCEAYFFVLDGIWIKAGKTVYKGHNSFSIYYDTNEAGQHSLWLYDKYLYEDRFNETYYWNCYNSTSYFLITNMSDYYGDKFVEFLYTNNNCYYGIGSYPEIAYRVNNSWSDGSTQTYEYEIVKLGGDNNVWRSENIYYNTDGSYTWNIIEFPYSFTAPGSYQIVVWNTTINGSGYDKDTIVYRSEILDVCEERDSRYDIDGEDDDDAIVDSDMQIFVGLGVTIGIGIVVSFLLGDFMGFFVGSIPTAYFLSSEALSDFQYLPSELGIGLIVLLVILAVIIWLIK